jgi:hypothetical protein
MLPAAFHPVLAATYWEDTFFGLDADQRFVLLLVVLGCATAIVITIGSLVYAAVNAGDRRRRESELKRELLDRGMSADDVVKVIESAAPLEDATSRWVASGCKKK